MNLIAPTVKCTAVPEVLSERTSITSEAIAMIMKVRPIGIVLHHCNACGLHLGSAWLGSGVFSSDDILAGWWILETRCFGGGAEGCLHVLKCEPFHAASRVAFAARAASTRGRGLVY
jgi:hypothetical protein